jgi:hypothetical protein
VSVDVGLLQSLITGHGDGKVIWYLINTSTFSHSLASLLFDAPAACAIAQFWAVLLLSGGPAYSALCDYV